MLNFTGAAQTRKRNRDEKFTLADVNRARRTPVLPIHLLVECATGYALVLARDITEVDINKVEAVEEYLNRPDQPFELKDYIRFSSGEDDDAIDALVELNAIFNSTMTDKLRGFIERNFPRPTYLRYSLGVSDGILGEEIVTKTGVGCRSAIIPNDVMRGLHGKIHHFIGLEREALEKAQVNLARLYINKNRAGLNTQTPSVLSLSQEQDGVVPHKFEGIFTVKGKENMFCTKNIVPGEAIYGETLIHHQDGLVYLVGFCDGDDVASMAGKRPNVVKITVKITVKFPYSHWHYRMLVGMVDVIFAEIDHCPDHPLGQEEWCWEMNSIVNNAHYYLRTGGHYLICSQTNDNSAGHFKDPCTRYDSRKEFKLIETIMLDGAYALSVGGYRT
ncbi:uncharacterized protein LOC108200419 isoform X3 [Daucus carota subsp. sativus]|uniref:uncharacterized protein LOC108200419 isoform X3 n=1 Tax=Daucus carota subsp. sativus TaxID=79200 RepID=UPI0007EF8020|nr:PREDICTED: uncharacterized protein LOC108200419 [Daucus carota subsp. sativus]